MKTYSTQTLQSVNNKTIVKNSMKFTNALDATAHALTCDFSHNEFTVVCERNEDSIKRIF